MFETLLVPITWPALLTVTLLQLPATVVLPTYTLANPTFKLTSYSPVIPTLPVAAPVSIMLAGVVSLLVRVAGPVIDDELSANVTPENNPLENND